MTISQTDLAAYYASNEKATINSAAKHFGISYKRCAKLLHASGIPIRKRYARRIMPDSLRCPNSRGRWHWLLPGQSSDDCPVCAAQRYLDDLFREYGHKIPDRGPLMLTL